MELIKPGRQFDFMSKRWLFIGLSGVLLILSIISFIVPGPKLGTDFKGGTEVEVAFKAPVSSAEVREAVTKSGFDSPDVVSVSDQANPNRYLIRVHEVSALSEQQKAAVREHMCLAPEGGSVPEDRCPEAVRATEVKFSPGGDKISARYDVAPDLEGIKKQLEGIEGVELRPGVNNALVVSERDHKVELYLKSKGDQLMDGLREHLGADKVPDQALRVEWIGPKAGAQLRDAAIKSVLITIFFIMAYIAFRFDIRFAPGGILALVHDVGIALGAMVITQREITLSTVAALLTIVGYSITDTVVVYDRIRENLAKHRDMSFAAVINFSLSEMLGRTILVSLTTFLSLVMFLFYGTGVIRDFAFTLVVGIVVGTYSSIYVAAPLTEWIDRRFFGSAAGKRKKVNRVRTQKRADAVV
ncbi:MULTISPECIES: protein translocase subunit SecF [Sorangium]|uniref:Protein-export membrane protein SecF n=1 Tax=Sorangium cellulosum TaxID=56 RepID=A0A4P2QTU0_SORCE|nr:MULTISPECIES: protein translocase subunit SecF [Sorangium]AUX33725.1 preprotein translocase subunit SecF [Sorangium cellulosum]WCQ93036.1 Protein-export membrane protein SecF [Sorangium sp. Soce836]